MKLTKILPKYMTNYVMNWISGYLYCVKIGIFLHASQVLKSKAEISVHRMTPPIETSLLIVMEITL